MVREDTQQFHIQLNISVNSGAQKAVVPILGGKVFCGDIPSYLTVSDLLNYKMVEL